VNDRFQRRRPHDPIKVASAMHSWPEKLTTRQAPRPNCAHPFVALASVSACRAILQFEEWEPPAVKPIARHGASVEAAFGWPGSGPGTELGGT
jgi:hypothetical protein